MQLKNNEENFDEVDEFDSNGVDAQEYISFLNQKETIQLYMLITNSNLE